MNSRHVPAAVACSIAIAIVSGCASIATTAPPEVPLSLRPSRIKLRSSKP
jgi:hypothetical protein